MKKIKTKIFVIIFVAMFTILPVFFMQSSHILNANAAPNTYWIHQNINVTELKQDSDGFIKLQQ